MSEVYALVSMHTNIPMGVYSTLDEAKAAGELSDKAVSGDLVSKWFVARFVLDGPPMNGSTSVFVSTTPCESDSTSGVARSPATKNWSHIKLPYIFVNQNQDSELDL